MSVRLWFLYLKKCSNLKAVNRLQCQGTLWTRSGSVYRLVLDERTSSTRVSKSGVLTFYAYSMEPLGYSWNLS